MSDYSSFAKPVDDYSSFAKPVEDYSSFAKPVEEELSWYQSDKSIPEQALDMARGIPTSIGKLTSTIEKGMGELGATVQDTLGFQDAADAQRRKAQQDYEANLKRVEERFGKVSTPAGEVVEGIGQGLGLVGAMALNPVVGGAAALGPYLMGSSTQVVKDLGDKGVSPEASTRAAQMQVAGNAVLGLIPGAGPIRGALMNWATGQLSDMATYEYLVQNGYKEAADVVIGKRGIVDKQGLIDVLVGGVGGRIEGKAAQRAEDVAAIKNKLDELDKAREAARATEQTTPQPVPQTQLEMPLDTPGAVDATGVRNPYDLGGDVTRQQQGMDTNLDQTQGNLYQGETTRPTQEDTYGPEATINVGPDGTATYGLPTRVTDDAEQARALLQNRLQQEAVATPELPPQGKLFPEEASREHLLKAQALEVMAQRSEAAGKADEAAKLRKQAETERSAAKQFNTSNLQGKFDLETPAPANASVDFDGRRGTAGNESVLAGLTKIKDTDDIALDNPERVGAIAITGIDLQAGGQRGRASEVLKQITDWADRTGNTLVLMPSGSGDISTQGLRDWYSRNGFKLEADGAMVRSAAPAEAPTSAEKRKYPSLFEGEYVPPQDLPKWREVVDFVQNLITGKNTGAAKARQSQLLSEMIKRGRLFDDNNLNTKIPLEIDGKSIVEADGSIKLENLIRAMYDSEGALASRPDLLRLLDELSPFLYDVKITYKAGESVPSGKNKDGSQRTAPAVYWGWDHRIDFSDTGFDVRTAVHELVHAASVRALDRWMDSNGNLREGAPQAVKDIKAIFDEVKAKAVRRDTVDENGNPVTFWQLEGGRIYGLENVKEFASEVMTNRYLQHFLKDMDGKSVKTSAPGTNAFQKFKNAIKKVLGVKDDNMLSKAIEAIDGIVTLQKTTMPEIETWIKSQVSNPDAIRSLVAEAGGRPDSVESTAKVPLSTEGSVKADKIAELSGIDYIPEAPKVTPELIAKIAKESDSSAGKVTSGKFQNVRNAVNSARRNLTPGALAQSFLTGSTLVKTVYDAMNSGYKKGQYQIHNIVKPVQETFISILRNPKLVEISHDILMRELKRGHDYTADELRAAGVADNLIRAHLEFRNMQQQALEAQNVARRAAGEKEITALDSYISSRWSGPWRANIKDADGNVVFQIAEHSRTRANEALAWIKAKYPELVLDQPTYRKGFERGDNLEAGYLEMLKLLDKDDPRIPVLESIYKDYLLGNTENVSNQEKHFLRKTGVRGFAGDRPWAKNDAIDFFEQQFAYAENAFTWASAQDGLRTTRELLNHPDLQESQKNNILFARDYVKNQLGFGTNATFDALDNGLAQALGTSTRELQSAVGGAKTLFYLTKLGLSIPFTIAQIIQPAISTPAMHTTLSSQGFWHNPIVTSFKGIFGGTQAALWHYGTFFNSPELKAHAERTMSFLDKEAAKYMEANEVVDINPMTDIKKGLRPQLMNVPAYPFEFTIKHSEVVARSMAFMSFVDHLRQSGQFDTKTKEGRQELFKKAEEMTNISMTDYRAKERAMVFEKGGLTGDAAATLHAYQINYLMQMLSFSRMAANGDPKPLFTAMAVQAMAAGMLGMAFIDDLDDLLNNMKKLLPHDQFMRVKDFSIKAFLLNNMKDMVKSGLGVNEKDADKLATAANYGVVSAVTGSNMHTRLNASNQIPVYPFEVQNEPVKNLFPFVEDTFNSGAGLVAAFNPNSSPKEKMAGLYAAAPSAVKGPMESLPEFNRGPVSLNPKDLQEGKYRRTEGEKSLRDIGLRSVREQKQQDTEFALSKVERQLQDRIKVQSTKAMDYITAGEPKAAVPFILRYVELGGDPQTLVNRIPQAKIAEVTTELERRALKAGSGQRAAILKLQRYMQAVPR